MKQSHLEKLGPFIVLLYGIWITLIWQTGSLAFLVNPIYDSLIVGTGMILIGTGLYWLKNQKNFHLTHCEKPASYKNTAILLLLIAPLILGALYPPKPLSSTSALQRGISSDLSTSTFNPIAFSKPPEERTLIEWVKLINMNPEPSHYEGQKVRIEGSIINAETLPENMFYIGKFILTCCAADARSIALPVKYNPKQINPKNDEWIRLEGIMAEGNIDNRRQVVIELKSAEKIPVPKNPYAQF